MLFSQRPYSLSRTIEIFFGRSLHRVDIYDSIRFGFRFESARIQIQIDIFFGSYYALENIVLHTERMLRIDRPVRQQ